MARNTTKTRQEALHERQVQISTPQLRARLNHIYNRLHPGNLSFNQTGHFDFLWDLKELALLEGRQSVEIPASWLEDLERACQSVEKCQGS